MAEKVLLRDKNDVKLLPITRGELVLDSSGKMALHSEEFLASTSKPGLMSSSDKANLDRIAEETVDDELDINSSNPVQNKVITQIINSIREKYLKSVSVENNKLTITDQSDKSVDFFGSIYSIVTNTTDGLVPKFDSFDGTIDDQSKDWILTNHNGNLGWYKLPTSTFTQNITSLYIGDASSKGNTSTTNGSTYFKLFENSELTHKYKIQGTGNTAVSSDDDGNLTIYSPTTLPWGSITDIPGTFTPELHYHSSDQINALIGYSKPATSSALSTKDTLNQALGKLEYKADLGENAYNWYVSITGTDTDNVINKWSEIVDFVANFKETPNLATYLSDNYLAKSGGTMTGVITLTSGTSAAYEKTALSFIKKSDKSEQARIGTNSDNGLGLYAKGTIYIRPNVDFSSSNNGLVISNNLFTYNGTAVSLSGHTHTFASIESKPTTIEGYGITNGLKIDGSNGTAAGVSTLINKLGIGNSIPTDADYYICQYAGGGTTTISYHRRPMSSMWNWIKTKADNFYPLKDGTGATGSWDIDITGNALTATTSVNADKVDNTHLSTWYKHGRACAAGKTDKPWHKIATFSQSTKGKQINTSITFYISDYFAYRNYGIFTISARAETNATSLKFLRVDFMVNNGIPTSNIIATSKHIGNNNIVINVYAYRSGWQSYSFRKIEEQYWGAEQDAWVTLDAYNGNSNCYVSIPSDEIQVISENINISNTATNANHANTADKLKTARNIKLIGSVTGNANFDGSGDIEISTTTTHIHDDRYYTESEIDTKLSGKSNTNHNHDGRYIRWNGNKADITAMTWGTLTTANEYNILSHASSSDGGDMGFAYKNGQIFMQLDGYYYQKEGKCRVLDTSDFTEFINAGNQTTSITIGGVAKNLKIDADKVDGHHAGLANGNVSVYVPFPNWNTLKSKEYISQSYGISGYGHPDQEFLQGICKWAIATYSNQGDITLIGSIAPNSSGTCILHLYSSSGKHSTTNLPRYCRGQYLTLSGQLYQFGTVDYTWSYGQISAGRAATAGTSDYSYYLRGRNTNGTYYDSKAENNIIAEWNTKSDNRWYLKAASNYECRVDYATRAGNADTVDGKHASDFATLEHTHNNYLPFYIKPSGNCDSMEEGLTTVNAKATNQNESNFSAFLTIKNIGTPFQLQIPDAGNTYIYKRYKKSDGSWSDWVKMNAGNADTVGGLSASQFYQLKSLRSNTDSIYNLRWNYGTYDKCDYNGTYKDEYPTCYGAYLALAYKDRNIGALMFFDTPANNALGHIYVKTRGAGNSNTTYSGWGTLAYLTDNVASATKLSNFYSSRQSSLKPAIIGDGSMYQFKSTSTAKSQDGYPGDGHILHFEWDNTNGYSSQLYIRDYDGLLKTRGMNGKNDSNDNKSGKWSNWRTVAFTSDIPTVTNYYWANIQVSKDPNYYTTPQFGNTTINGSITINHGDDTNYTRIIYKNNRQHENQTGGWADDILIHTNASGNTTAKIGVLGSKKDLSYLFLGTGNYNANNNLRIYNNHISVPQIQVNSLHPHIYGDGTILTLSGKNSQSTGSVVCDSTNNAFRRNSASTNITLGTSTYRWGNFFGTTGNFSGSLTLIGTTADTAKIQFNRSGASTLNYIIWPGNTSDSCLLAFGYNHSAAESYYYMSNKALYPANNDTRSLGTSTMKWSNVYATTFTGNLEGKASKIALNRTDGGLTYGDYGEIIQSSSNGPISGAWHNSLKILHNNSAGYYTQLAQNFTGEEGLWHRRCYAGTVTSWKKVIDSGGGTINGNIILKGGTTEDMTYNGNIHPRISFENSNSSQNVSIIFTDYDNYRSPAGIKIVGNQENSWFEAPNIYANSFIKNGSNNNYVLLGGGGHKAISDFATSNHTHSYLPLSGGTITGSLTIKNNSWNNILILNRTSASGTWGPAIQFQYDGTTKGTLTMADNQLYIGDNGSSRHKAWHEGNDGASSGLDADMVDGKHASQFYENGYIMSKYTIDASKLNADTWYPVIMPLGRQNTVRIEVIVALNSGTAPYWSSHSDGFSVRKIWEVNGDAWGVNYINRRILESDYRHTQTDPVRGIGQLTNTSTEYVYVRGGGKYYFYTSHNVECTLCTTTYTIKNQSVTPTKTLPSAINVNLRTTGLCGWYKDLTHIVIDISGLKSVYYIENALNTTILFSGTSSTNGQALLFVYNYASSSKTYTINGTGVNFSPHSLRVFLVTITNGSTSVSITTGTQMDVTK